MQFPQSPNRTQLPLFDAFLPSPMAPLLNSNSQSPWMEETETCSELTLRGSTGHCLNLLAPILRERGLDVSRAMLVGIDGSKALRRAVIDVSVNGPVS